MTGRTSSGIGLTLFAFLAVTPVLSYGEVKINLKNDTSIIADECHEEGDRLECFKMGGSFSIDKKDVLSTKNVHVRQPALSGGRAAEPAEAGTGEQAQKDAGKTEGVIKDNGKQGQDSGAAKPADAAAEQMKSLQAERERLLSERQKLQEDIRNAPDYMPTAQFNELQRRSKELDEGIKNFNEKANRISEEQKGPAASKK